MQIAACTCILSTSALPSLPCHCCRCLFLPAIACVQVFVTATARCLDLATALLLGNSVMLLTSPSMKQPLLERLDKYIFPADQVTVNDVSDKCSMLTLMGPQADDVMTELAGVSNQLRLLSRQRCITSTSSTNFSTILQQGFQSAAGRPSVAGAMVLPLVTVLHW